MMISTKGRYALRVMIDIAQHNTGEYIPLKDIAERQEISIKYLEGITAALAKAGYLEALRGKNGGYRLAQSPENFTAEGILKLMEGSLAPVACLETSPNRCTRSARCPTLPLWEKLYELIDGYLESVRLSDLAGAEDDGGSYVI